MTVIVSPRGDFIYIARTLLAFSYLNVLWVNTIYLLNFKKDKIKCEDEHHQNVYFSIQCAMQPNAEDKMLYFTLLILKPYNFIIEHEGT